MIKNVGFTDKAIRLILAAILLAVYFFVPLTATLSYAALAVAAIALLTGLFNFCPLWSVFGMNTNKKK